MRYFLGALLLLAPILVAACETEKNVTNAPTRAASQPGPLDRVTNPINQSRADPSGPIRP
jgi:hypothetical protein